MNKLLLIGSKGFIGSALYDYFTASGLWEVWGCDVVTDYVASRYYLIDATNADYQDVFQSNDFSVCINCSGAASVPDSLIHPLRDYHLNTKNIIHILEAIRLYAPRCKFLNLSSAAVYGNPVALPVAEDAVPAPLSPYGWHKYQSELLCKEYSQVHGIATCSARIFSAFGPGLKKQLFWDWNRKIDDADDIVLFGTGGESRDFIYIDDILKALECIVNNSLFQAEAINVANGEEIFIRDAIQLFQHYHAKNFTYSFSNEMRVGDPVNWFADINKLTALGYKQKVTFEMGIESYLQWLVEKR